MVNIEDVGQYMAEVIEKLERKVKPERKLIGSMFAKKAVIYAPLLKWYLEHGLVVTKVYHQISAVKNQPFKSFVDYVSNTRREGDKNKELSFLAESAKLLGNSAFGRSLMNTDKHYKIIYSTERPKAEAFVNDKHFRDMEEIEGFDGETHYEMSRTKHVVGRNLPIQVGRAIFDLAKLRMLQFYYDCLDKYLDRSDFQLIQMDTDSLYMALSGDNFESLVKDDKRAEFEKEKHKWFPRGGEHSAHDKRTPGLFKVETEGVAMVALTSKSYFVQVNEEKFKLSSKGVQQRNNCSILTLERYQEALFGETVIKGVNRGFRSINNQMMTYEVEKDALTPIYMKREVMSDGVSTRPLSL
jgi:hypothetical protein